MRTVPVLAAIAATAAAPLAAAEQAVTVYNQGYALVRDQLRLDLKPGDNRIRYGGASMHVEPDTVLLRDLGGEGRFAIREQAYHNDPISQERLLQLFAGKTIRFEVAQQSGPPRIVEGRIVRAPEPLHPDAWQRYGQQYAQRQQALYQGWGGGGGGNEAVVEVDGQLRFGLPGTPLFPSLPPESDLRPSLEWVVRAAAAAQVDAEVSYLAQGMRWEAAYTVTASEREDTVRVVGVVTVDNQCGTGFRGARLKLVAGDVMRAEEPQARGAVYASAMAADAGEFAPRAEQKAFGDYHLYTIPDPVDLADRDTKQIGFLDARGVRAAKRLVYDGLLLPWDQYRGWSPETIRQNREFGTVSNPKVAVERIIENRAENRLGKPLPAGAIRFYLADSDGRPEFVGENRIDHTPEGETLRMVTGNAFDVVGERVQTDYRLDGERLDESFRIVVRNHRDQPAEVTIVEHLYRWLTWEIQQPSRPFTKRDARTVEFPVTVPAKGEAVVTYRAHYTW